MPGVYLGAGSIKTLTSCYIGNSGVKTVNSIYVGVGGSPQKVWPSYVGVDLIGSSGTLTTYVSDTYENYTTRLNQSFTWDGEKYVAKAYCQHTTYHEGDGSSTQVYTSNHGIWTIIDVGTDIVDYQWIYVKMGYSTSYSGSYNHSITCYTSIQSSSTTQPSTLSSYYRATIAANAFCAIDMSKYVSSSRRRIGIEGNVYLNGSRFMDTNDEIYLYVLAVYDSNGHPDASYTYTLG